MTVSMLQGADGYVAYAMLTVLVFTGADTLSPIGASGGGDGFTGQTISATYASTVNGSWGWLMYGDWIAQGVPTVPGDETIYDSYHINGEDSYALIDSNSTTATSGTAVTLSATAPASPTQITYIYFEVVPQVNGVAPSGRSDLLSDSRPSASSNHAFSFTVNNPVSGGSKLAVDFGSGFTIPDGLDCGDVDVSTGSQFNFKYPACRASSTAWGFAARTDMAMVQNASTGSDNSSSRSLGFSYDNSAGNTIIVGIAYTSGGFKSISDSTGNTYYNAVATTTSPSGNRMQLWYAPNIKAGANTVTVTFTGSVFNTLNIFEYAGLRANAPLDATSSAVGTGSTANSGAATTTMPNELVFAFGMPDTNIMRAGSMFIERYNFNNLLFEERYVSSMGSYAATTTLAGGGWAMAMATFRTAGNMTGFILTAPTDAEVHVATGSAVTLNIGTNASFGQEGSRRITNPSSAGIYTIALGGTSGNSGNFLVSINGGQTVAATVAEQLALTVTPPYKTVQRVQEGESSCGGGSPRTITISPTAAGDLLVVGTVANAVSVNVTNIIDNASGGSNTYVTAGAKATDTSAYATELWYAKDIKAGATTVTVYFDSGSVGVVVWEFSGVDTSSPLDTTSTKSNATASTTPFGPTATSTLPGELLVSALTVTYSVTGIHSGNAFTNDSLLCGDGFAHLVATSTGAYAAQWDQDTAGTYASNIAVFKPAPNCAADDGASISVINSTAVSIPFGTVSPNTFYQGCQDLIVSSNAAGGYSLAAKENHSMRTESGQTIPDTTCDDGSCDATSSATWVTATNNGFGQTCANQTGSDCVSAYADGTLFRQFPSEADGEQPQVFMTSSTPASATGRVKYRFSVPQNQAAGTYSNTISYVLTGSY
jgi:hypothetical protein